MTSVHLLSWEKPDERPTPNRHRLILWEGYLPKKKSAWEIFFSIFFVNKLSFLKANYCKGMTFIAQVP
jgi:hypothetical protein